MIGGKIEAQNLNKFIKSAYHPEMNDDIDGYKKIKNLSNSEITTFYNGSHCIVVFRGTEKTLSDWSNNVAYVVGQYENTSRFKRAKEIYQKIADKYGEKNISLVGHSQSAIITRKIGQNAKEIINVNGVHLFENQKENEFNVRSSGDIVSAIKPIADVYNKAKNSIKSVANVFLPKNKKLKIDKDMSEQNITIENKTSNPLTEHSSDILQRLPENTIIGGFLKFGQMYITTPNMYNETKTHKFVEVPSSTKTGQLTTRLGKKSIKLKIIDGDKPKLLSRGTDWNTGNGSDIQHNNYIIQEKNKKTEEYKKIYNEALILIRKRPEIKKDSYNEKTKTTSYHSQPKDWDTEDHDNWLNTKDGKKWSAVEKKKEKILLKGTTDLDKYKNLDMRKKFNTIELGIPKMEFKNKKGNLKEIDPITPTGNLKTKFRIKSVKIIPYKNFKYDRGQYDFDKVESTKRATSHYSPTIDDINDIVSIYKNKIIDYKQQPANRRSDEEEENLEVTFTHFKLLKRQLDAETLTDSDIDKIILQKEKEFEKFKTIYGTRSRLAKYTEKEFKEEIVYYKTLKNQLKNNNEKDVKIKNTNKKITIVDTPKKEIVVENKRNLLKNKINI